MTKRRRKRKFILNYDNILLLFLCIIIGLVHTSSSLPAIIPTMQIRTDATSQQQQHQRLQHIASFKHQNFDTITPLTTPKTTTTTISSTTDLNQKNPNQINNQMNVARRFHEMNAVNRTNIPTMQEHEFLRLVRNGADGSNDANIVINGQKNRQRKPPIQLTAEATTSGSILNANESANNSLSSTGARSPPYEANLNITRPIPSTHVQFVTAGNFQLHNQQQQQQPNIYLNPENNPNNRIRLHQNQDQFIGLPKLKNLQPQGNQQTSIIWSSPMQTPMNWHRLSWPAASTSAWNLHQHHNKSVELANHQPKFSNELPLFANKTDQFNSVDKSIISSNYNNNSAIRFLDLNSTAKDFPSVSNDKSDEYKLHSIDPFRADLPNKLPKLTTVHDNPTYNWTRLLQKQLDESSQTPKDSEKATNTSSLQLDNNFNVINSNNINDTNNVESSLATNRSVVQLSCGIDHMLIKFKFMEPFSGRIVTNLNPSESCQLDGDGKQTEFEWRLMFNECGTRQESPRMFINNIQIQFVASPASTKRNLMHESMREIEGKSDSESEAVSRSSSGSTDSLIDEVKTIACSFPLRPIAQPPKENLIFASNNKDVNRTNGRLLDEILDQFLEPRQEPPAKLTDYEPFLMFLGFLFAILAASTIVIGAFIVSRQRRRIDLSPMSTSISPSKFYRTNRHSSPSTTATTSNNINKNMSTRSKRRPVITSTSDRFNLARTSNSDRFFMRPPLLSWSFRAKNADPATKQKTNNYTNKIEPTRWKRPKIKRIADANAENDMLKNSEQVIRVSGRNRDDTNDKFVGAKFIEARGVNLKQTRDSLAELSSVTTVEIPLATSINYDLSDATSNDDKILQNPVKSPNYKSTEMDYNNQNPIKYNINSSFKSRQTINQISNNVIMNDNEDADNEETEELLNQKANHELRSRLGSLRSTLTSPEEFKRLEAIVCLFNNTQETDEIIQRVSEQRPRWFEKSRKLLETLNPIDHSWLCDMIFNDELFRSHILEAKDSASFNRKLRNNFLYADKVCDSNTWDKLENILLSNEVEYINSQKQEQYKANQTNQDDHKIDSKPIIKEDKLKLKLKQSDRPPVKYATKIPSKLHKLADTSKMKSEKTINPNQDVASSDSRNLIDISSSKKSSSTKTTTKTITSRSTATTTTSSQSTSPFISNSFPDSMPSDEDQHKRQFPSIIGELGGRNSRLSGKNKGFDEIVVMRNRSPVIVKNYSDRSSVESHDSDLNEKYEQIAITSSKNPTQLRENWPSSSKLNCDSLDESQSLSPNTNMKKVPIVEVLKKSDNIRSAPIWQNQKNEYKNPTAHSTNSLESFGDTRTRKVLRNNQRANNVIDRCKIFDEHSSSLVRLSQFNSSRTTTQNRRAGLTGTLIEIDSVTNITNTDNFTSYTRSSIEHRGFRSDIKMDTDTSVSANVDVSLDRNALSASSSLQFMDTDRD